MAREPGFKDVARRPAGETVKETTIGLGWRVHSWWAVVVAASGPAASPVVVHRERVTLIDDASVREPYHAAVGLPLGEVPAFIGSGEGTPGAPGGGAGPRAIPLPGAVRGGR